MKVFKFINSLKNRTVWFWAVVLATIIIDALNSAFFDKIQSFFFNILNGKDLKSVYYIIGFYVLFILVVIFSSFLSSFDKGRLMNRKQRKRAKSSEFFFVIMTSGFGIILTMPLINILGIAEDNSPFSDSEQMTYFMIVIALFFVLLPVSVIKFKPKYHLGKQNYFVAYLFLLVVVSFFIDFSSALWKFFLFDPEKTVDPNRGTLLIEFIAIFPLYLFFFSAPRMVLLKRSYSVLTLLSAFVMIAYFVWKSLGIIEL